MTRKSLLGLLAAQGRFPDGCWGSRFPLREVSRVRASLGWLIGAMVFWVASSAWGAPANPVPQEGLQPDGTRIHLVQRGDEFLHWTETPEGYSVVRNAATGFWEYARQEIQALAFFPSGKVYTVGTQPPATARPHLKPLVYVAVGGTKRPGNPANPFPVEARQPDGKVVPLVQRGDENLHWTETPEGYAVVKNPRTGFWEYALRKPVYALIPSGFVVRPSEPAPEGWPKHLKPSRRAL